LNIVDGSTPQDCLRSLGLLAGEGELIVSVGPAPRLAELTRPVRAVHAPLGSPRLCGRRIARLVGQAGVIHAWSPGGFEAAREAARLAGLPVFYSLPCLPRHGRLHRILELACGGFAHLTVPTNASRETLLRAGAPGSSVHVLSPPAEPPADRDRRRRGTRESLGLADRDFLLVAPGEMTRDAGHKYAAWAHAIVRHVRKGVKLLLPSAGAALGSVKFFSATTGFADDVILAEDRFALPDSLAAADAALFFHTCDCGITAIAAAMAAGVPIACSNTPDAAECTSNGQAAILVEPGQPRSTAGAVLRLIEEADLAGCLAGAGGDIARQNFAPDECRKSLQQIYAAAASASRAA
jgi:glycosyltransferase involved in cell wall biosynthesis